MSVKSKSLKTNKMHDLHLSEKRGKQACKEWRSLESSPRSLNTPGALQKKPLVQSMVRKVKRWRSRRERNQLIHEATEKMYSAANIYRTHHSHAQSRFYHGTTNVLKKGKINVSLPCRSDTPVITEGRLSTHLGLFNRKVNSVDIGRLLNEQNSNETISEQNIGKVVTSCIANSQKTELSCTITAVQSQVPHLYDIESQDSHIQDSKSVGVGVEGVSLCQQPAVSEEIISEMPNLPNQNFDQADDRSPDSHTNVSAITNVKMAEVHSYPPVLPDNKLVNIQSQSKNSTTNEMGMLSKKDKNVFLELETHKRGIGEMDVESNRPRVPVDEIASKLNRLIRKLPFQIGRDLLSETKVVLQRLVKERHERIPDMSQLHIQKNVDCHTVSASVEEGMLPRSEWKLPSDIGSRHLQASHLQLMQNMSRKRRRKADFSRKMDEAHNFSDQPFIILDNEEPFTILNQPSESPASHGEHSNPVLFETNFLHFDDEQNTTNTSFFTKFNLKPSVQADDIFHLAEPMTKEVDCVCISSSSTSLDSLKLSEKRTRSMNQFYPVTSYQSHTDDGQFNTANPSNNFPLCSLQTVQEGCHYSAFSMSPKFCSIHAVDPCHYKDNMFFYNNNLLLGRNKNQTALFPEISNYQIKKEDNNYMEKVKTAEDHMHTCDGKALKGQFFSPFPLLMHHSKITNSLPVTTIHNCDLAEACSSQSDSLRLSSSPDVWTFPRMKLY